MRLIGEISDSQAAERFTAYLVTRGIAAQNELGENGVREIWVKDEDLFKSALDELETFNVDPNHQRYSQAIQQASQIAREQEKKRRAIQKRIVNVGAGAAAGRPRATLVFIGICIVVALLTNFGDDQNAVFRFLAFMSVDSTEAVELRIANKDNPDSLNIRLASIKSGEIWRLITPIFIHHGVFHIVFNLIWMFQLGKLIETRYGPRRLVLVVLLSAAISNFFQCAVPMAWGGSPPFLTEGDALLIGLGGMSGVVYGLLGFVWMKSTFDRSSGFYLHQSTLVILLGWMFLCMVPGFNNVIGVNVANWAHGVGLVVGMALGYLPEIVKKLGLSAT